MEGKFYPEVTLVVERPGKDIYIVMAEMRLRIFRILPKQNSEEIKILFKNIENKEKCLQNRNKLEEEGYKIKTTEERTKEIFLKGYDPEIEKLETSEIKKQLEKNHENLVIHQVKFISTDSQRNRTMKIEINNDADTRGYIKNGMDLDCYYIPKVEEARRDNVLQCLCCYQLDSHMAHECPKKNGIKICSICAGRGHSWKVCEMGNRPEKHRCINCDGNHTATAKSCPDRKRIINRRNRSRSRHQWNRHGNNRNYRNNTNYQNKNRSRSRSYSRKNMNRSYSNSQNRRKNAQKPDLRKEIEQKKTERREYHERQERERQKKEEQNKKREERRKISQERRRNESNERRVTINEGYSSAVKGKRTPGVPTKNSTEEEHHHSSDEEPKPQRRPRIRNRNKNQNKPNDDLMSKMAMVICHAHFHRIANGGSYTKILRELCERNNLPYVTPLDNNPDSSRIISMLSDQCQSFNQNVDTETEEDSSSEEENNVDTEDESETEKLSEEKQFWQVQTRAQSKAKQMKLRDLSKERNEEETKSQEPSTSYAEAASN